MAFKIEKTEIKDLLIIYPHLFVDKRGKYSKHYQKDVYEEYGISCSFTECSDIYSQKGVLRGLHFQRKSPQAKLIRLISGLLFDVVVDLRYKSPDFGKYHVELMRDNEDKVLFIPEGFAHGFISLTDNTIFSYMCSGKYIPEDCYGIRWDDHSLKIPWPLKEYGIEKVIATEKDENWPTFNEYLTNLKNGNK